MENNLPYNLLFNQNSSGNLTGLFFISKDNKIKIELKEIDKNFILDINVNCIENYTEGKKIMELLQKILCTSEGFTRPVDDLKIKSNKTTTMIKLKEE